LRGIKIIVNLITVIFLLSKMQRTALINWKNINQDFDLSKIFSSLSTSWIVEWLEVQTWKITPGYAFVEITRNWETFPILFNNTENLILDTSWDKKVFIEINELNINDWILNNSDWTWIWEIKTSINYPTNNFLKLASISAWVITDERKFIDIKDFFNLTKQWNTFNWSNQLVKTWEDWKIIDDVLPASIKEYADTKLKSDKTWINWALNITNIVTITQASFDSITTKNATTVYMITD